MAISTTGSQVLYTGTNSLNQICPFPYIFFENSDLEIVTLDASNVSNTLVLGTDYSVTGANNISGGSVTIFLPVVATTIISIVRNNPETQLVSLTTGDRFPASIMERALDKLTMLVQELGRGLAKTLRVADVGANQPPLLPKPTSVLATNSASEIGFIGSASTTGLAPYYLTTPSAGAAPVFATLTPIVTSQIADSSVTTSKLADASVTTLKLADASVTSTKIESSGAGNFVLNSLNGVVSWQPSISPTNYVTTDTRQTITGEKVIQALYDTTSTTAIPNTPAFRNFVVGTGLSWKSGNLIQLMVSGSSTLYLRGSVSSYNASTGAMSAIFGTSTIGGVIAYSNWIVTQYSGGVPALRITSNDSASAFLVEDSTNPDSTPFTISSTGRVGIGIAPDTTTCLSLDTTGVKFGDGTIQTTAGGGGGGVSSVAGTAPIASSGGTTPTISITAASTTGSGAVQLTDSTTSTSITTAATPNSVKTAFDLASGKVSSVGGTAPISSSGGATPVISIATASATTSGALTSTDWNTFNNKGGGISSVSGNLPISSSGGTTPVISIATASSTISGALSSNDWNTFNNKGTITSVTGTSPIASSGGVTPAISIANAAADGVTKGAATFNASDFNATAGVISIDYTNGQAASGTTTGFLMSQDFNTFLGKGTINSVNGTAPISSSGGDDPDISIANAAADGVTKGAATFNASDFNATAGVVSIDYTNGQAASATTKGFLNAGDFITFANKGTINSVTGTAPILVTGGIDPEVSIVMATNKMLGRSTPSTGVAEEIAIGTGLSLSAGTISNSGVLSNTTTAQGGTQLLNMVQITQGAYNAIGTPTANTLYIIVG